MRSKKRYQDLDPNEARREFNLAEELLLEESRELDAEVADHLWKVHSTVLEEGSLQPETCEVCKALDRRDEALFEEWNELIGD